MYSATVIIPTTGSDFTIQAIESVLNQTYPTQCYLVCDGEEYYGKTKNIISKFEKNDGFNFTSLPINVGRNGFYGHRIYAAFSHLINTDYVLYLDQDNWFDTNHVKSCIESLKENKTFWSFSLRKIWENDNFICDDNCESLGFYPGFQGGNHVDTNCYCIKTEVVNKIASAWHGGWGQDRIFYSTLKTIFGDGSCTGTYSVNYRLGGNEGSVKKEFFVYGNDIMIKRFGGNFPWRRKI